MILPKTWQGSMVPRMLRSETQRRRVCGQIKEAESGLVVAAGLVATGAVDEAVDFARTGRSQPELPG